MLTFSGIVDKLETREIAFGAKDSWNFVNYVKFLNLKFVFLCKILSHKDLLTFQRFMVT